MRRWPLIAAIVYVALVVAGLFVVPTAPEVSASATRLVRYYRAHGDEVRLLTWLAAISTIPLVLLVARLRQTLTGTSRDVMLLGAVGLVVPTTIWTWLGAGLALHAATMRADGARLVNDVRAYFGPVLTVSIILLVLPLGLAAWRGSGRLPRWFAWLTFGFAAEQAAESLTILGTRGFAAPGGAWNFEVGAVLFLVWILAGGLAVSTPTRIAST
jgi:hypothetical protein